MSEFELCRQAQKNYCNTHDAPQFAPTSGYCFHCGNPIYGGRGYSLEQAKSTLITGCPFCRKSYCD